MPGPVRVLAVSGSLRAGGSNNAVLDAARLLAPDGVAVVRYAGLRALPAFDPDLDDPGGDALPPEAADLRASVGRADAVLISSPEYAHGIPGALKNALDWLVGSVEFPGKPVALLNTSPWSVHVPAQLAEVLTTMNARLVSDASATVPLLGRPLDGAGVAADPELAALVRGAVAALARAAARPGAGGDA
ncbi:hypothetical protein tb265_03030 [Gemmatimonadetes bacterium T265]|nr:hypothetical protein tb265_03030 [Gemmatimonadetes bacterium T265]